ncbi:MAG: UDP-N-acetylmuramoyl-L-alanyl-D-glutamate--2,6-diaminopimelate ligase [Anaerolineales bacterium]|nr:UDP-N-acetylmuramoyl-L-alanyl-D-glutamate--2,6-diaminopimelate ligase [Anaerolineales bacterium]
MNLSELIQVLDKNSLLNRNIASPPALEISGIVSDSREVKQGMLFVAIRGLTVDGHDFLSQAIQNGAVAIVGEKENVESPVPYICVSNSRMALAYLTAAWYGFPAHKMTVIGVTGTDGKTTTCNFIYQILKTAGYSVGMISTVNAVIGDESIDTGFHVTTPDAPQIQRLLSMMVKREPSPITHVVLETTSHGLAQYRVSACEYDIGVFTNITHEHLDFHGNYDNYRAAKARLIEELESTKIKPHGNIRLVVLNHDDQSFEFLRDFAQKFPSVRLITYGQNQQADVRVEEIEMVHQRPRFLMRTRSYRGYIQLNLVGEYNISNALAAWCATVEGLGVPADVARLSLSQVESIPGRMEKIDLGQNFLAFVDFAHTPNAIKNALNSARGLTLGRIIAVFGSAGLRDREKRWQMAEIGVRLADVCILTAEDPRTESVETILQEMKVGADKGGGVEGENYFRIADRRDAIRQAVRMAKPGDVILILGKGHEQSMCFGEIEYAWDDRVALQSAIAERLGISGPKMPFLPKT